MERFVALLLLVSGIPEGLEARSFKRLTETISVENGTLTRLAPGTKLNELNRVDVVQPLLYSGPTSSTLFNVSLSLL